MNGTETRSEQFIVIKSWHTVIILLGLLVSCVVAYTTLSNQVNEHDRRINKLEDRNVVTLPQYQEGQDTLKQRLDRIEKKLDTIEARHR